jgi:hypothetical protein
MKRLSKCFSISVVAALLLSAATLVAQDNNNQPGGERGGRGRGGPGGNFDASQFQQRMMENLRDQMKVKDDAEWKVLEERISKVMEARREVGFGGNFGRLMRRPGGDNNDGGRSRSRGGFGGEPSAEQEALDKAIDSNASKDDLKSAMAKVRTSKKEKEAKLEKAQEELKKVLNTQQEAVALSAGLVK